MARELSARDATIILIESPMHQTVLPAWESFLYSPGNGKFSVERDRRVVGNILSAMMKIKLMNFLKKGDLPMYRLFLNQQSVRFNNLPTCGVEDLVQATGNSFEDDVVQPHGALVANFFLQNGFVSATQRDGSGWPPVCYAAVNGHPALVASLLEQRADPNDGLRQEAAALRLPKDLPAVSLCAYFRNNEAMKVLIEAKADVNFRDKRHGAPLFWSNLSNNTAGTRILLAAGADPHLEGSPPMNVLEAACTMGATDVIRELLSRLDKPSLQYTLHLAFFVKGGAPDTVSTLLHARADINEQPLGFDTF